MKLHELPVELHTLIIQFLQPRDIPSYLSINQSTFHMPIYWDYLLNIHFREPYQYYRLRGLNGFTYEFDSNKCTSTLQNIQNEKVQYSKITMMDGIEYMPFFMEYWMFYFLEYYTCMNGEREPYYCGSNEVFIINPSGKHGIDENYHGYDRLQAPQTERQIYYFENAIIKYSLFHNKMFLKDLEIGKPSALQAASLFITIMRRFPLVVPQFDQRVLNAVLVRLYEAKTKATDLLIEKITRFVVARAKIVNSHGDSDYNPLNRIQNASIPYYSFAMMLCKHDFVGIPTWRREKKYSPQFSTDESNNSSHTSNVFASYRESMMKPNRVQSFENLKIEPKERHIEERLEENRKIRLVQEMAWLECFGESESNQSYFGTIVTICQYLFVKHILKRHSFDAYSSDSAFQAWKLTSAGIGIFLLASFTIGYMKWNPFLHPIRLVGCLLLGFLWAWVVHLKNAFLDAIIFTSAFIMDTVLPFALLYRFGSYSFEPYHMFHPLGLIWFRIIMLAIAIVIQNFPNLDYISEFLKSAGTLLPLLLIEVFQFLLCYRPLRKRFIKGLRMTFKATRRLEYFLLYVETCREQSGGVSPDLVAIWILTLFVSHIIYGFIYLWLHVYSYNEFVSAKGSL